ncbi:MAPEG family protein [Rheinheimera nanhaiensis]|uniref:MAPEG family protein n=1 Tax=Rheinheimera nanhaiensis TaxID=1163621 RepID=UPI0009DA690D|nr:MAPEG family protein [Rheinheimera nanhaiensis]
MAQTHTSGIHPGSIRQLVYCLPTDNRCAQRANAAHYNSFEALLIYACAVFSAIAFEAVDSTTVVLAWVFIVSRLAYLVCYWLDYATTRSEVWIIGMVAAFSIAVRAVL